MFFTKKKKMNNPVPRPLPQTKSVMIEKQQLYNFEFEGSDILTNLLLSEKNDEITHDTSNFLMNNGRPNPLLKLLSIPEDDTSGKNEITHDSSDFLMKNGRTNPLLKFLSIIPEDDTSEKNEITHDKSIFLMKNGRPNPLLKLLDETSEGIISRNEPKPDFEIIIRGHIREPVLNFNFLNKQERNMEWTNYFVSLTTTPKRIHNLLDNLLYNDMFHTGIHKVIINMCTSYKRFENKEIIFYDKSILGKINKLNSRDKSEKYVLHLTEDKGPITKLIGGIQYIKNNISYKNSNDIIVIVDDDTTYGNNCITHLCDLAASRNERTLYSYSGFGFSPHYEYVGVKNKSIYNACDIIEGFAGISFKCDDIEDSLIQFTNYYYSIDWNNKYNDDIVNRFLKACFLGDDMVISTYFLARKYKLVRVPIGNKHITQKEYGYEADALHKNPVFLSNMNSYAFLNNNISLYEVFHSKLKVCEEIIARNFIPTFK